MVRETLLRRAGLALLPLALASGCAIPGGQHQADTALLNAVAGVGLRPGTSFAAVRTPGGVRIQLADESSVEFPQPATELLFVAAEE